MLQVVLAKQGYAVDVAAEGEEALRMALESSYDFILCDIRMPAVDGPEFLRRSLASGIGSTIVMMSAYGTVDTAIECMKLGAYDYISKPFKNDEIILVLKKAEERERLKEENRGHEKTWKGVLFSSIVGKTARMREIFSPLKRSAILRLLCDSRRSGIIKN
jgi:two-component system response regulator AtoC